jgi:hypothetical protein
MAKERSDKGTVRELTELGKKITQTGRDIIGNIRDAQKSIENGDSVGVTFAQLEEQISANFIDLRDEVLKYDQRDRLEEDSTAKD